MKKSICLNADVGELPGEPGRALDRTILDVVSRCSIACGGHTGDTESMRATVHAAHARNVVMGAHPSYPDREGFGRSRANVSNAQLAESLLLQVRTLQKIARAQGADIAHIKPHGSLYNDAARDDILSELLVSVCKQTEMRALVGPPNSKMEDAALSAGLDYFTEAFADRSYEADGSLTPRSVAGAVITEEAPQLVQVLSLVEQGQVVCRTGECVAVTADTICLHGDTPGAAEAAFALKQALAERGITIRA